MAEAATRSPTEDVAATDRARLEQDARHFEQAGDVAAAIDAWRQVLASDPSRGPAHVRLADLLYTRGEGVAAIPHLRVVVDADKGKAKHVQRLARALELAEDPEGAVEAWRRAFQLNARDLEAAERLVELLFALGRAPESIPQLKALIDAEPGRVDLRLRLARLLEQSGDLEGAIETWRPIFDPSPGDLAAGDRLVELLNDQNRAVETISHLKVLVEADPCRVETAQRLARALQLVGDAAAAIDAWERVATLDPTDGVVRDRLVELLHASGRGAETAPHLRALAEASPARTKLWRRLARVLDQTGAAEGAAEAWLRVADLEPADSEAHLRLSRLLIRLGRTIDAIPHLRFLAERSAGELKGWTLLARAFKQIGAAEEELATWRRVLFIHPGSVEAHGRIAHRLHRAGKTAEAAIHLRTLADLAPSDAGRWKSLGAMLTEAGDVAGTISAYRKALTVRRDDALSHERLAELLKGIGRPADAVRHLKAFAEISGSRAKPWRELARTLEDLAREPEAISAWRRLLKIAPKDVETHERLARLSSRRGDRTGAVRHLKSLAELEPAQAERWNSLARARLDLGDVKGAIAAWRRSLEAADDVQVHTNIALALNKLDRKEAALPHFVAAADAHPEDPHSWRRLARCARDVGSMDLAGRAWRQVLAIEGFDPEARDELEAMHGSPEGDSAVQGARSYLLSLLALEGAAKRQQEPLSFQLGGLVFDQILATIRRLAEGSSIVGPDSLQARRRVLTELFSDCRFGALSASRSSELQKLFAADEEGNHVPGLFLVQEALSAAPELLAGSVGHAWRRGVAFDEASERAKAVSASPWFSSPVVICGFHHAGTRVLADALELCGVFQRTDTHSKEWTHIQWLNTLVLPGWADPDAIRTFDPAAERGRIDADDLAFRLAAAGYNGRGPWGHKDPRNCITAEVWQQAFPAARVIHITRDPLDTLGTLPQRYARFTPGGRRPQDELGFWEALWTLYLDGARRAIATSGRGIEMRFEDLCADPAEVMSRVCEGLGLERRVTAEELAPLGINRGKVGQHRAWLQAGTLGRDEAARLRALGKAAGAATQSSGPVSGPKTRAAMSVRGA